VHSVVLLCCHMQPVTSTQENVAWLMTHSLNLIVACNVVCCSLGEWSDSSGQRLVCCLSWVLHNPSVQHRLTESTQRHQRRRNETSMWHRRLPWWSTAVHRRLVLYLACISWWSVVREVADDWFLLLVAVTDVTSTAGDVTAAASVQHDQQTTATCCLDATVHEWTVPRRWDNTWYVCRRSLGYSSQQEPVRGEWTV